MKILKSKFTIIIIAVIILASIVVPTSIFLIRDTTPPSIEIINPLNGDIYSGTITIECSASDNGTIGAQVTKIEIYIDDELKTEASEYIWDTTLYNDGPHEIKAIAYDKAGNIGETTISGTVDNFLNPPPTDEFKIITYNIKESGIEPEWKDVVKAENPDIAIFVETGYWDNSGNKTLNAIVKEFSAYFYEEAPYEGFTAQHVDYSTTGEAIISRYPILEFKQVTKLTLDDSSTYYPTHDLIHAVVNIYGKVVNIIGVHLKASSGDFNAQRRDWEQEGIINYMDDLGNVPIIYLGDLNSLSIDDEGVFTRDQYTDYGFGPVTMLLHPENTTYGNYSSKIDIFIDVFRYLNPSIAGQTFNVLGYRARIDYIFVNQCFNTSLISSNVGSDTIYDDTGSDHYTVEAIILIGNITETVT